MPETKPERHQDQPHESVFQTFKGYSVAIKDGVFMAFLAVSAISVIVYMQMNTTLSVYLRDVHQITTQQFGYILSLNAAMVVVFQFWITRRISKYAPMLLMTFGTLFYLVGFTMYGFIATYPLFLLAMVSYHHRRNDRFAQRPRRWWHALRRWRCADAIWRFLDSVGSSPQRLVPCSPVSSWTITTRAGFGTSAVSWLQFPR